MSPRGAKTVISNTLVGLSMSGRQRRLPCFVQFSGQDLGRPYFLEGERVVIGRDPRADIRVDERKVSRKHCEIGKDKHAVWIRDLKSANGTWVNGKRLSAPSPLTDGDMVSVGSATFKYFSPGNIEQLFYDKVYKEKTIDQKTKVFNDKYLMSTLRAEIDVSRAFERSLCLIMYDLDHFKKVNDTYGHRFGDVVLAGSAEVVSANLRINDDLCRYGGEEFVVILRETELKTAARLAERIRAAVQANTFTPEKNKPTAKHAQTISIGVALMTPANAEVDKLIKAADLLLYAAKRGGRNRVAVG